MKTKLLLTAAIFITGVLMLNAQCTPGNYTSPGIYPDTATNLPIAYVPLQYNTVMTAVVPKDTAYMDVDSIGITGINWGALTGFSYVPNSQSGYWHGNTSGCITISGIPTHAQALAQGGIYPLIITTNAYVGGLAPVQIPVYGYKIVIKDTTSGLMDIDMNKFMVYPCTPNPFSLKTTIAYISPMPDVCSFVVYNLIGDVVYSNSIKADAGMNKFEFSAAGIPAGIYMYKLSNKTEAFTRRMIVLGK